MQTASKAPLNWTGLVSGVGAHTHLNTHMNTGGVTDMVRSEGCRPVIITQLIYLIFFREFIEMGFIDKDRVAIWGWVSCHWAHTERVAELRLKMLKISSRVCVSMLWCWAVSLSVVRWIRDVDGFRSRKWSFQMWHGGRSSLQMGLLWYFFAFLSHFLY